jgi:glycerol-3-phosphate acyltransferase PlsY
VVLVGDAGKGALATLVGQLVGGPPLALACGAATVVGHVHPVWRRRRGGKGVATWFGMVAVVAPAPAAAAVVLWLAVAFTTRRVSTASVVTVVLAPLAAWLGGAAGVVVGVLVGLATVIVVAHRENLARLAAPQPPSL